MRMLPLSSNSQNLHFDISFVTDRTKAVDSYFLVRLDEAFPSVKSSTLINDGSEERANAFSGSGFESPWGENLISGGGFESPWGLNLISVG